MSGFPRAIDDGDAGHLKPGMSLPPIALPATGGTTVDLAAVQGRSVVIVYPWTGRPGHPNPPDWDLIPARTVRRPSSKAFATAMAVSQKRIFGSSA